MNETLFDFITPETEEFHVRSGLLMSIVKTSYSYFCSKSRC